MTNNQRLQRNRDMIAQLHDTLRNPVAAIISDLDSHNMPARIQCAWRSPQDQIKAYNAKKSKLKWGFHNATTPNGKPDALAVDVLCELNPEAGDDSPMYKRFALMLASSARSHGMETGILWGLSPSEQDAVNHAIITKQWGFMGELGWDALHVQVTGITIAQAKAGKRP